MITLIFSLEVIHAHEEIDHALAMLLCSVAMVKENQSSLISCVRGLCRSAPKTQQAYFCSSFSVWAMAKEGV